VDQERPPAFLAAAQQAAADRWQQLDASPTQASVKGRGGERWSEEEVKHLCDVIAKRVDESMWLHLKNDATDRTMLLSYQVGGVVRTCNGVMVTCNV
jgi:hypothetical protein